jgi:hypothetical protein
MDSGLLWSAAWKTQYTLERDFHELHCSSNLSARFAHEINFNTVRRTTSKEAYCISIHYDWLVTLIGQLHKFHIILRTRAASACPPCLSGCHGLIVPLHVTLKSYDRHQHATQVSCPARVGAQPRRKSDLGLIRVAKFLRLFAGVSREADADELPDAGKVQLACSPHRRRAL